MFGNNTILSSKARWNKNFLNNEHFMFNVGEESPENNKRLY